MRGLKCVSDEVGKGAYSPRGPYAEVAVREKGLNAMEFLERDRRLRVLQEQAEVYM